MKLSRSLAKRFCTLIASSEQSIQKILAQHPNEFPRYNILRNWRDRQPWFSEMWRKAREEQAEHLVQKCLDLARQTDPKNAHAQRVKFDIYWKVASRFHPAVYGDKPASPQTNIAIGVSISPERLNEIRSKLDVTRIALNTPPKQIKNRNGNDHNRDLKQPETSNGT